MKCRRDIYYAACKVEYLVSGINYQVYNQSNSQLTYFIMFYKIMFDFNMLESHIVSLNSENK